ncbi:NUDIX hydrolase [Chitinophaga parva]|uniref:NUDIX hydrolase n=1 Tax=Chitinophaga parva TaxID=2169414 RepID=A0A2T7BI48_9BACT|nr:NUDIX domain-containing protein [Chitinophaga parva]PUZ25961.1 NUDIX hydrolase [Chitinophaga parva]
MPRHSAGILLYRYQAHMLEVLLVHPGGPFWARRDAGAWSIPKGEYEDNEDPETAARREFEEETGQPLTGKLLPLTPVRQKAGKIVQAYACEGQLDVNKIRPNTFSIEWPARSGRQQSFPEIDKAAWYTLAAAREKLLPAQLPLLDELAQKV